MIFVLLDKNKSFRTKITCGDYYSYQIIAIGLSCIVILDSCNFFYPQLLTYIVSIDEAYDDKKKIKKNMKK